MASDSELRKVNFRASIIVILNVIQCLLGARIPYNPRVDSVRMFQAELENSKHSAVPIIAVGNKAHFIISGTNISSGMWATLTKKSDEPGSSCDPNEIVTPPISIFSYEQNYSESFSTHFHLIVPSSETGALSGLKAVWVCLNIPSKDSGPTQFIHQGSPSTILVANSEDNFKTFQRSDQDTDDELTNQGRELWLYDNSSSADSLITSVNSSLPLKETDNIRDRTRNSERATDVRTRTSGDMTEATMSTVNSSDKSASSSISDSSSSTNNFKESKLLYDTGLMLNDDPYISAMHEHMPKREITNNVPKSSDTSDFVGLSRQSILANDDNAMRVYGIRVKSHNKGISYEDGIIQLRADSDAEIRLFGRGLTNDTAVQFTSIAKDFGGSCDVSTSDVFQLHEAHGHWAVVTLQLPVLAAGQDRWYLCLRNGVDSIAIHQGRDKWLTIATYSQFLPVWIQGIILVLLLIMSGLFSGLNLGLMALDKTELKIVSNTGTEKERRYARAIEPVRRHGNFLLCTLLLGNVLVNSTLTILLDNLSSGLIAVIGSTTAIVIFGEIVPQAICSRHGLAIGAKTVWLVRIFMVITGFASWPISKILDYVLGEELGNTYDRERLKELIRVTQDRNDIRLEEQNIICGALEMHKKTVLEVMTKLEDVFMLNIEITLDFNTISEIMQQGYSRIPVYEGERRNIVSVLFIKDLAFIDPDDNTPLRTLSQFYQNVCNFVFEDTTLDIMFKDFKEGNKGHMAFVQQVNNEGDCDPFYEVIGLVTLEDVIEELIQEEIVDETDVFTDNKTKRRRKHVGRRDFKEFSQTVNPANPRKVQISPQMQVAALQFLRTSVEPFKEGHLSESILRKLLMQDIIHSVKPVAKELASDENYVYFQGKPIDFFILLLEGHVEVNIGKENLLFESGPFTYFGVAALLNNSLGESPSLSTQMSRNSIVGSAQSLDASKNSFTPDYSVRASTEVTFLKIKRSHYIAARRAYFLEQSQKDILPEETFEKEMEKILKNESQNSPTFESEPEKESSLKEALLNGKAVVSRSEDEDDLDVVILKSAGNRRSFRDNRITPVSTDSDTLQQLEPCLSSDDLTPPAGNKSP